MGFIAVIVLQVYIKVTVAFESGAIVELTDMEHYERPLLKAVTSEGKLAPTVSEASEFYPGTLTQIRHPETHFVADAPSAFRLCRL